MLFQINTILWVVSLAASIPVLIEMFKDHPAKGMLGIMTCGLYVAVYAWLEYQGKLRLVLASIVTLALLGRMWIFVVLLQTGQLNQPGR